jgi:hypothetical protein
MGRTSPLPTLAGGIACVFMTAGVLVAQAAETFTATAIVNGGAEPDQSLPVSFVVMRYTTDAEHARTVAALKQGTLALHEVFAGLPDVGEILVRGRSVPIKYAYKRPESGGRKIALVADVPLAFLDPGAARDKSPEGYDFTLAILDFSLPGFGAGEVDPAVKLAINAAGQLVTEDYGASVVQLKDVRRR